MKLSLKNKKGFTLIELLVAIAVIGLLASIALVALSGVKDRAKDARIIAEMSQIPNIAALIRASDGSYSNEKLDCYNSNVDDQIKKICQSVNSLTSGDSLIIWAVQQSYCAYVQLNNHDYYCLDSTGVKKKGAECKFGNDGSIEWYSCQQASHSY
jgi:prepilin-type N-terminal cleavage/methylation domain-containing protein